MPYVKIVFLILMTSTAFAQKIVKVKGNKLIFSTTKISVSEGDVLTISSDGFDAGKVKVLKVGSKAAVGKIIEGSALKGDMIQGASSKSGSSDSTESEEVVRSSSKKSKSQRSSLGASNWTVYLGYNMSMLSSITSQDGDYALDALTGINLKGEYRKGTRGYQLGIQSLSGSATFNSKVASLTIKNADVSVLNLYGHYISYLSSGLFWKAGAHLATMSITDKMTLGTATGDHQLDLKGFGGIGGIGYNYYLGKFVLQAEAMGEMDVYMFNDSKLPSSINQNLEEGTFITYGVVLGLNAGFRF
jgi:hypothetical protein